MNDIVFQGSEGRPLTNSVLVAETFGKKHYHVMDTIKNILNSHEKSGQFFVSSIYIDNSGKENSMFIMNRDGFTLLAMGFTGKKALQFKLDYIDAFNKMEQTIKQPQVLPSSIDMIVLKQLVEATQVMATQISQMQVQLNQQYNQLPSISVTSEQRISPRQCKYYTVKQMAKALNSDARQLNAFLEYKRIQEYDSIKQRWLLNSSLIGQGYTYTVVYESVDPDDEPREYMVWTSKGRDYIWELLLNEKRKSQENKGR